MRFPDLKFSRHFVEDRGHRPDRSEITMSLCQRVIEEPIKEEPQGDGRDRYLKVVVDPGKQEVITAHFDRVFRRKMMRGESP
ncbi:hypothetical protein BH24ACT21_BH24ACT21_14100 [soil metagenome]